MRRAKAGRRVARVSGLWVGMAVLLMGLAGCQQSPMLSGPLGGGYAGARSESQSYGTVVYEDLHPTTQAPPVTPIETVGAARLSDDQIDELMAPIALYPDSLLAQLLPACAYLSEVRSAAQWLQSNPQPSEQSIAAQNWDPSVSAIVHYSDVLRMLMEFPEWTAAVGAAFVNQQQDVMASIQRLRQKAMAANTLENTPQQQVVAEDSIVQILPSDPRLLYVPQYDPVTVYERRPDAGRIVFVKRYPTGAWLNSSCDWYHSWVAVGTGWHYGWRWDNRRWQRDRDVVVVKRGDTKIVHAAPTKSWKHNAAKPRPVLVRAPARGAVLRPRTVPFAPKVAAVPVYVKPVKVPRGSKKPPAPKPREQEKPVRPREVKRPATPPAAPTRAFSAYGDKKQVERDKERYEHSRKVVAPVPARKPPAATRPAGPPAPAHASRTAKPSVSSRQPSPPASRATKPTVASKRPAQPVRKPTKTTKPSKPTTASAPSKRPSKSSSSSSGEPAIDVKSGSDTEAESKRGRRSMKR